MIKAFKRSEENVGANPTVASIRPVFFVPRLAVGHVSRRSERFKLSFVQQIERDCVLVIMLDVIDSIPAT